MQLTFPSLPASQRRLVQLTWVMATHDDPVGLGGGQRVLYPLPLGGGPAEGGRARGRKVSHIRIGQAGQLHCVYHHQLNCDGCARHRQHLQGGKTFTPQTATPPSHHPLLPPLSSPPHHSPPHHSPPLPSLPSPACLCVVELWHVPACGSLGISHLCRCVAIVIMVAADHVPAGLEGWSSERFLRKRSCSYLKSDKNT